MEQMKAEEEKGIKNFSEKYHCKITVLKLDFNEELYMQYPYGHASKEYQKNANRRLRVSLD